MKLSDILEFTRVELLDDYTELVEGPPDQLHSDRGLVTLLDQAQKILAARALLLFDETTTSPPGVTSVALSEGVDGYALHKSVIRVLWARLSDTDVRLARADRLDFLPGRLRDDYAWDVNQLVTLPPGRPVAYTTNWQTKRLVIYPKPDAASATLSVRMGVLRYPLNALTVTNLEAEPEIPEEFHLDLAYYAAGHKLIANTEDNARRMTGRDYLALWNDRVREAQAFARRLHGAQYSFAFGGGIT